MGFSKSINVFVVLIMVAILTAGATFVLNEATAVFDSQSNVLSAMSQLQNNVKIIPPPQKLSNPPEIIKAVYVTGYSAGAKSYLNYLKNLFQNTEINAVVVDIKGSDGIKTYPTLIPNIDELVRFFHNQNIYVIGRIAVFEDPVYAKARPDLAIYDKEKTAASPESSQRILWQDNHKLLWLDPASKDVWEYDISLAKDALYHGFDEINFDYARFPSDGNTKNMGFPFWDEKTPMSEVIKDFFSYLRISLPNEKLSVDLFGLTTVNTDDMGIGQVLENAFEKFDYISPMVYPSHYANGFIGLKNPAEHPYEIIKYSLDSATARLPSAKFRPWIQDFNMGAVYNSEMVKAEIKATQDALGSGFNGFMLWNPSNIYTQGAVLKPN